jgi:ketosteroid isomerase-like protein
MRPTPIVAVALIATAVTCTVPNGSRADATASNAGIDSLNARLIDSYRRRDPQLYGALYTDTAVFEWPAFNTVRGPAALAAMARDNWTAEQDVELRLRVSARRLSSDHATEFGAFEQSWSDSIGVRRTEFGRYVSYVVRGADNRWRIDRFFGFEDSTRVANAKR